MASSHRTIPPFPGDINRDAFGHWLSGFVDGEGCFDLAIHRPGSSAGGTGSARLSIGLRSDDSEILGQIQSFWQCGVKLYDPREGKPGRSKSVLQIVRTDDLVNVIVPHFNAFPLRAKKRRDFVIWREAVVLLHRILKRKRKRRPIGYGQLPKWTLEERAEFRSIWESLKAIRNFKSEPRPAIPAKRDEQQTLW